MAEDTKLDVEGQSSASSKSEEGQVGLEADVDKESNLAKLRNLVRQEREQREALQKKLEEGVSKNETPTEFSLDSEEDKGKGSDFNKVIFQRDMKKAVNRWSKEHKVSKEQWDNVRKSVSLKGDELDDEIYDKIQSAYSSLPEVRETREKELIEKGKKEAMQQFQDSELSFGGGGDAGYSGQPKKKFSDKEKKMLDVFGVTSEERDNIDKDGNPSDWKILDPARQ